jgi:hypothetical protein
MTDPGTEPASQQLDKLVGAKILISTGTRQKQRTGYFLKLTRNIQEQRPDGRRFE